MNANTKSVGASALLAALVLMIGMPGAVSAARIVAQPERDYELRLSNIQGLPQGTAGYLIFKTCAACDVTSMTVSADTVYLVGEMTVPLSQFLETAEGYRQTDADSTNVFIFYDLASKHVNRVVLIHLEG
ncbi:MAG TPA: hypothetical protein VFV10_16700 [Gammaproteobacteria bacterium]|nr:hypothetical protein [Gammaproteobacteria bacterium]